MNFPRITSSLLVAAALASGLAQAQTAAPVTVDGAWVRASVQGQKATGAFMRLTASEATRLVGAASPAAHAMVLAPASAAPAAPRREPWALAMVGALPQARAPPQML